MISLHFDPTGWTRAIDQLGQRAPIAIARALNRTGTNARAAMVPVIAADLGLPTTKIRNRITVTNATQNRLVATLYADPHKIPLIDFHATGPEPSRGRGGGVRYRLPTGAGHLPHAFIATMPGSGHRGVFARTPGKFMRGAGKQRRQAIKERFGPSIANAFQKHTHVAETRALEMLQKNLAHEFAYVTQGG